LPISSDTVVVRDEDFTAAYLDGKVVVLNARVGSYFDFNEVGTEIWDMLARSCRVGEIFDKLLRRYEVDENTLTVHVTNFLEQLAKDRLIQLIDDGW
jgi:hypothetical protein